MRRNSEIDTATPMKIATYKGASSVATSVQISTNASSRVECMQMRMARRLNNEKDSAMTNAASAAFGT